MNITRDNFEDCFQTMCEAIRTSHFIALDAEFTGLRLPGAPRERSIDSVKARYDLARSSCSSFMLTQYGFCCFRYDDSGRLEARPFNAFIVPSTKFGADRVYSCQASSMDFLSKHGFDFQSWAAHGVSFLSKAEEVKIQERIHARSEREAAAAEAAAAALAATVKSAPSQPSSAMPVAHAARDGTTLESLEASERNMILDARKKVEDLLAEGSSGGEYVERSVKLEPMTGRQRWLIYEFVGTINPAVKLFNLGGTPFARGIEIRTICKDPKAQAIAEAKLRAAAEAQQIEDLRRAVGFRRVVDRISTSGKPVITHNGLLDILHTYDKFVGPIPVDFEEGTRALHDLLPRLFDSKVAMSKATEAGLAFPQTVLGGAFRWLREKFPKHKEADVTADESAPGATNHEANGDARAATTETDNPEVAVAEAGEGKAASERRRQAWDAAFAPGFEQRYAAGGQEHEAGYDAYLTGCCFAAAATLGLGVSVEELKALSGRGETPAALVPVSNTVPLYRMLGGQNVHLPGPTPPLDMSRYLHVSGFPSAARTDAIMRPLKAVSGCEGIWFHWIDDTSGVVECASAETAKELLETANSANATAAEADGADGSEPPRVVDPAQLVLSDMTITQLDSELLGGSGKEEDMGGTAQRPLKRARREEDEAGSEKVVVETTQAADAGTAA